MRGARTIYLISFFIDLMSGFEFKLWRLNITNFFANFSAYQVGTREVVDRNSQVAKPKLLGIRYRTQITNVSKTSEAIPVTGRGGL
jgi:hypothetical protein